MPNEVVIGHGSYMLQDTSKEDVLLVTQGALNKAQRDSLIASQNNDPNYALSEINFEDTESLYELWYNGEAIGLANVEYGEYEGPNAERKQLIIAFNAIFIKTERRGKGIGTGLIHIIAEHLLNKVYLFYLRQKEFDLILSAECFTREGAALLDVMYMILADENNFNKNRFHPNSTSKFHFDVENSFHDEPGSSESIH